MKTKMMFALAAIAVSSNAMADGFRCQTTQGMPLNVLIYNHVQPANGTRNGAVIVIADPAIQQGNKTVARFEDVDGLLSNTGAKYIASVDLRYNDMGPKGRNIGGTKMAFLKTVYVDIDFTYSTPARRGAALEGEIAFVKRNGETITAPLACARYLKN